jgi:sec-independent protein translocase protein TatB
MFGLSAGELLLIGLIALVLFGNEKLPENMKKMLKGWKEARKVTTNIQRSWYEVKSDIERDIYLEDEKKQLQELLKPVEIEEKATLQKTDVV